MALARNWAVSFPIQHACYFIHAVNTYSEYGGQRSVLGTIPQVPCHSLWVLQTGSGAFRLVRMAVQWAPVNPASTFIVLGLQWCPPHLSSYMGSGCWIPSLKLSQHTLHLPFCFLSPPSALVLSFPQHRNSFHAFLENDHASHSLWTCWFVKRTCYYFQHSLLETVIHCLWKKVFLGRARGMVYGWRYTNLI